MQRSRVLFSKGNDAEAWKLLNESKLYGPQLVDTQLLEAGALVSAATQIVLLRFHHDL